MSFFFQINVSEAKIVEVPPVWGQLSQCSVTALVTLIIITINPHHIHVFWGRPGIEVHSCRRAEPLLKDILSSQKLSQIYLFKSDFEIK